MKLNTYVPHAAQHILTYGPPKVGKTLLVGRLAGKPITIEGKQDVINLLWFDLESGSNTLVYNLTPEEQQCVELIKLPDTSGYPIAIETLLKVFTVPGSHKICEDHGKVACPLCAVGKRPFVTVELSKLPKNTIVVVDSATQLLASAMNNITKGRDDDYKPDWDDYRKQGHLLTKIYSEVQQAGYHCCVISHEEMVETTDKTTKIVPTGGTRNFSKMFAKFFDHVVYQQVTAMKHKAGSSTTYLMNVITGSRSNIAVEKFDKGEECNLLAMFQNPMTSSVQAAAPVMTRPPLAGSTPTKQEAAPVSVLPNPVTHAVPQAEGPVPPGFKALMVSGKRILVKDPNAKPAVPIVGRPEGSNPGDNTTQAPAVVAPTAAAPANATTAGAPAEKAAAVTALLEEPTAPVRTATVNPAYAALMERVKQQNAARAKLTAAAKGE